MQASMQIAIKLCLLIAICASKTVPGEDLLTERFQIRNALSDVESITRQLDRIGFNIEEDTNERVTIRQWDEMDNYRNYIHLLRNAMRREVNAAKKKGIDAQQCYDTNSMGIDGFRETAFKDSEKCKETAKKDIKENLRFLDNIKLTGNLLTKDLDSLFLNCQDIDNIKMQECIEKEFKQINSDIKIYEEEVKYADYSALTVSNYIVLQASKCLTNIYVLARSNSDSSLTSNSKCVKNALENIKKTRSIRAIDYNLI